jgi:HEAT repeat protein
MKQVSQHTWELLGALSSSWTFWEKFTGRTERPLWAFDEIAKSGETEVVPHLASFLLSHSRDLREAAARATGRLMASLSDADHVRLDELMRSELLCRSGTSTAWCDLKPAEVGSLSDLPSGNLMVGLASMHHSGYVRVAALERLGRLTDGSEVPFLLLRLNDWVAGIRAEAQRRILSRTKPANAAHFLQHLRLVARLQDCGRGIHTQTIEAIDRLLTGPEAVVLLREGLGASELWRRRYCVRLVIRSKAGTRLAILKESLSDSDPVVRLWAARSILAELPEQELRQVLPSVIGDPFMPVHCEALNLVAQRCPDQADARLRSALLDSHASVRALARYHLERRGCTEFRAVYLEALRATSDKTLRAAVAGLGETGKAADAQLAVPFLKGHSIRVRKAAVRAIAALDGDHFVAELMGALLDDHRGMSREGRLALQRRLAQVDADELWSHFCRDRRDHVRLNILVLLSRLPSWIRIRYLVMASADPHPEFAELARRYLRSRIPHFEPSADELRALLDVLDRYANRLDQGYVRTTKAWLKAYQ